MHREHRGSGYRERKIRSDEDKALIQIESKSPKAKRICLEIANRIEKRRVLLRPGFSMLFLSLSFYVHCHIFICSSELPSYYAPRFVAKLKILAPIFAPHVAPGFRAFCARDPSAYKTTSLGLNIFSFVGFQLTFAKNVPRGYESSFDTADFLLSCLSLLLHFPLYVPF